jgi:hypothetical protein
MDQGNKNGNFSSWPGLNEHTVDKHVSKYTSTAKCHLNQQRQNSWTTRIKDAQLLDPENDIDHGIKTQFVYAATIDAGQICTDQTGRFPVVSSKGNKYIMILHDYDSNAILAQPIKDRAAPELLKAFQVMEQESMTRGLKPKLMKLDNEASKLLKEYLHQQDITFQLVPPYSHRRDSAERAIRSFKDHLIAGMCSTDKSFPMHLWDRILPQAVVTLNMLRNSRINPKLSAATHIFGQYGFNRAPMAPPGTRIIAHETPGRRRTWAPHGQDGWYIGPALEHYRCYTVYITKTRSNRIVETVDFFPQQFILSFPSSDDLATQAAADLTHALLHPPPAGPLYQVGDQQAITLKRLASIFASAKPWNKNNPLSPQDEVENNAPHRVQTTVSPPRVAATDQEQISLQHISPSQSTPNSHHRQQTPVIHIVTPQTPHAMVRHSDRQQNVSQDMMAETLYQANHCFSISAQTKYTHQPSANTGIVISTEMANVVICPETGKYLKHQ